MSKIYVQNFPVIWDYSGTLVASGSILSASQICNGYAKIIGGIWSSGSGVDAASAIRVHQSVDGGQNYDIITCCGLSASSGSSFSIEVVGDRVKVQYHGDTTASIAAVRALWQLKPVS